MEEQLESLDDFAQLSKSDLEEKTSRELLELQHFVENEILEMFDKIDIDQLWDEHESAADKYFQITDILRERFNIKQQFSDVWDRFDSVNEKTSGMQTAIDKLKEHGHDGEIGTFKVTYPGRRD